jgi:hypothetical protein
LQDVHTRDIEDSDRVVGQESLTKRCSSLFSNVVICLRQKFLTLVHKPARVKVVKVVFSFTHDAKLVAPSVVREVPGREHIVGQCYLSNSMR